MIKLSVLCCVLFFGGLSIAENVPALMWGTFDHYTPALALKSYSCDDFSDIMTEQLTLDTLTLVVVEDRLSTEDLSQCRTPNGNTCFKGMQQVKSKRYLPRVEDPVPIIEDIAGGDRTEVNFLSNGSLSGPIDAIGGNFVFIYFEDDSADKTKAAIFARHDLYIMKLYAELTEQGVKVLVIYTGRQAEHKKRVVREAEAEAATTTASTTAATTTATSATTSATTASTRPKQAPVTEGIFWKRDRLLMFYQGLHTVATDGTETEVVVDNVTLSEFNTEASRFVVSLASGGNTFAFNISGDSGYWWLHGFTWNGQAILSNTKVAAVETFSFHCSPAIEITTLAKTPLIRWTGLQIQPELGVVAGDTFNAFGDSWDCVGFVSPGIVGGLFVVIMLLFILSIGISWMMDINTMDRFDDPKGKTITISVNE